MPIEHKRSALELALALVPLVRVQVEETKRHDRHLADQLKRATSSIALNLAEANGNSGGNRRMRLETARGSALEALCAVQLAVAWGYVSAAEAADVVDGFQRLAMMTARMLSERPGRRATSAPRRERSASSGAKTFPSTDARNAAQGGQREGPGAAPETDPAHSGPSPAAASRALGSTRAVPQTANAPARTVAPPVSASHPLAASRNTRPGPV